MVKKRYYKIILFTLFVIFTILIILTSFYIPFDEFIKIIGINNSYIITFFVFLFGGLSSFTIGPLVATLIGFTLAGANSYFLILFAGTGLALSDLAFYFIIQEGRKIIPKKTKLFKTLRKIELKIEKIDSRFLKLFAFIYIAFTPLPNDVLNTSLAISGVKLKNLKWTIIFGDFCFIIVIVLSTRALM